MVLYTIPHMINPMVIIDTNVILSGLKSQKGQSYKILQKILNGGIHFAISVPLVLEYEAVLKRELNRDIFTDRDINDFINFICKAGEPTKIYYLWRPFLKDPYDDHILEVAITANCKYIITYNKKDFEKAKDIGIQAITPYEYMEMVGGNT
jgi:putative PIN family toxin of toxin-antitoxin system